MVMMTDLQYIEYPDNRQVVQYSEHEFESESRIVNYSIHVLNTNPVYTLLLGSYALSYTVLPISWVILI